MLPLDEALHPLELERQDRPWLSSATQPSAKEFLVPPCFSITLLSGPSSPAELPQGIFCRLEGLKIQEKGLEAVQLPQDPLWLCLKDSGQCQIA